MNSRIPFVFLSTFAALALASTPAIAQRGGGGHMGGYGGGMGGYGGGMGGYGTGMGGYGGMPSGAQPGGRSGASPSQSGERSGAQSGAERSSSGDASGPRTAGELLQQNSRLSQNLSKLLPAGTNLQDAASGFKNLGEFVAAVHVSHNLGIPFADLKTDMMNGDSLGEAIRKLKPAADSQVEIRRAEAQARDDQGT